MAETNTYSNGQRVGTCAKQEYVTVSERMDVSNRGFSNPMLSYEQEKDITFPAAGLLFVKNDYFEIRVTSKENNFKFSGIRHPFVSGYYNISVQIIDQLGNVHLTTQLGQDIFALSNQMVLNQGEYVTLKIIANQDSELPEESPRIVNIFLSITFDRITLSKVKKNGIEVPGPASYLALQTIQINGYEIFLE